MNKSKEDPGAITENDIVFDCPHCGKSLAIDQRGAGLIVTCPDCQQPVQVPGLPPEVRRHVRDGTQRPPTSPAPGKDLTELQEELTAAHEKIARLVESLEEVRERRRVLEQLRSENIARFRQIGKEIETIQHAIDRIVAHLQDAATQNADQAKSESEGS